ncbi:hypothetical protein MOMUL_14440 [Moorella mulderi DSM 14980]|uniref:Uncharacterized protein n=1 Tax=Moorella mulderi DSM 14980 TaxID=1122241 RepID=A0A151AZ66_9FIRM|nr:hypothetical protein MOMUL_14440 [Moorella mulderi DSM 14980]
MHVLVGEPGFLGHALGGEDVVQAAAVDLFQLDQAFAHHFLQEQVDPADGKAGVAGDVALGELVVSLQAVQDCVMAIHAGCSIIFISTYLMLTL